MNEYEIAVIEAAQDLVDALEGGHYGPGQAEIAQAEKSLLHAIADLQAANDGRWVRPKETASEEGCPIRGLNGLCQQEHDRWLDPNWQMPHHSDTAATPCPGEDCERRKKEQRQNGPDRRKPQAGAVPEKAELREVQPQPEVGTAPGLSPERLAEIRAAYKKWASMMGKAYQPPSLNPFYVCDLLAALDAAEADNARLRAALAPFAAWNHLLLRVEGTDEIPLGLGDPVYYPPGARPNIGDLRQLAAACGPLPKVET